MGRALQQEPNTSMLAEGALRNLHLDCRLVGVEGTFSSRMLHSGVEGLVIADPVNPDCDAALAAGGRMTCSGRLGREIFRFSGCLAGRRWYQLNAAKRVAALLLTDLTVPEVIQRRRYFRVSLAGRHVTDVTFWVVEQVEGVSQVCDEFNGQIVDVSGGGAGVLASDIDALADLTDKQLWARFMLPGENESLIFRVGLRHVKLIESSQMYHLGLEFQEYIDPGRRQKVLDKLVRFVAAQERVGLRRRKDR